NHEPTATCVSAEHALLAVLDGSCRTPIAGHAVLEPDGSLHLRGLIAKPDGSALVATDRRGPASDREALGRDAAEELMRRGGPGSSLGRPRRPPLESRACCALCPWCRLYVLWPRS